MEQPDEAIRSPPASGRFFGRFEILSVQAARPVVPRLPLVREGFESYSVHDPANIPQVSSPASPSGHSRATSRLSRTSHQTLEELEQGLLEALRLQREEELAVLRFQRWQAVASKRRSDDVHQHHDVPVVPAYDAASPADGAAQKAVDVAVAPAQPADKDWLFHDLSWDDLALGAYVSGQGVRGHCSVDAGSNFMYVFCCGWVCRRIGCGAFGDVFRAQLWGQEVAVKILVPRALFANHLTPALPPAALIVDFLREVSILRNLRHPHIVALMGMCYRPPGELCIGTPTPKRGGRDTHGLVGHAHHVVV